MEGAMSRNLEQNTNLQQQILQSNNRIASLESLNCQLKGTVQQSEQMTHQANDEILSLRRRLRFEHVP
jgi:small-conductance mechanosensitive channel